MEGKGIRRQGRRRGLKIQIKWLQGEKDTSESKPGVKEDRMFGGQRKVAGTCGGV